MIRLLRPFALRAPFGHVALGLAALCGWMLPVPSRRAAAQEYDLVIYGGTSAGVIAAVEAKKHDKSVIVVSPDKHLGGLSAGGLGYTDTGNKAAIGGLSREFYHRVWKHYDSPDAWRRQKKSDYGNQGQGTPAIDGAQRTMWIFEPHVAEQVFEDLVREYKIPVEREERLNREPGRGVVVENKRIRSIQTLSGKTYRGRMFMDATYEGDLMAAAGVSYTVGREANAQYDESYNGIQVGTLHHGHWFKKRVDPYVVPGDPKSGLLPRISADPPGEKGAADKRIQAYCYRMCLTQHDANRIPFPKPDGYDPKQYELLLRVYETGWRETFEKYDPIPNLKTDTNNHGPFSTDNIGMNYAYPEASYEERERILAEHRLYQQGLMYFMADDPRMPEDVRREVAKWGLARDEFTDNGGWPHQIYVREARRMVGDYVMTEHDCLDRRVTPHSVGMGSYTLDSHNVQRYVTPDGRVQNEGDIGVGAPRPYEIAYGSLVPKKGEVENLSVPICISSSHIAYGSIRMEPVFMILAHSAAAAAVIAMDRNIAMQDVDYAELRNVLIREGQVLELTATQSGKADSLKLEGVVVDDEAASIAGNWTHSSANRPFVGSGYQHEGNKDKGSARAEFKAVLESGRYEVKLIYAPNANRASNIPVTIQHADGTAEVVVDERKEFAAGQVGISLGKYRFEKGGRVIVSNSGTDGYVVVDAVQFVPVP